MGFEERRVRRLLARNTLLFFAAFAVLFSLFGVLIFQMVSSSIYQPADNQLAELRILTSSAMADWESGDGGDGYEVLSDGNLSAEAEGVGAGLEESMADDADEGGIAILNRSYVASNPQLIYLWRHADGKAAGTEGLYASYPAYFDDIPFDPGDLDRAYEVRAGGHVYRGINYAMGSGGIAEGEVSDRAYVQVLVNVDSEMALLEHFTRVLVVYLAVAVAVAAAVSFLLSRRTVKPIVASMNRQTEFVQNASHELRTPLASVQGYAQLARRDIDEASRTQALERISSEGARMASLVEEMLTLARLDGDRALKRDNVDVIPLILDALSDAHVVAPDHVWELGEAADVPVLGDEAALRQILTNLLANARVHTPAGTRVTVSLTRATQGTESDKGAPASSMVTLRVADDGPGIPANIRDRVFDRFVRGDSSRTRDGRGSSGLGMSIVESLARAMGGSARLVDSEKGTVIDVTLPAA